MCLDLAEVTPCSARLALKPRRCAQDLLDPRPLDTDARAAQGGADGGNESTGTLGLVAIVTEPVAVAFSAVVLFSAPPTPHRTVSVLAQSGRVDGEGGNDEVCVVSDSSGGICDSIRVCDEPLRSSFPVVASVAWR